MNFSCYNNTIMEKSSWTGCEILTSYANARIEELFYDHGKLKTTPTNDVTQTTDNTACAWAVVNLLLLSGTATQSEKKFSLQTLNHDDDFTTDTDNTEANLLLFSILL